MVLSRSAAATPRFVVGAILASSVLAMHPVGGPDAPPAQQVVPRADAELRRDGFTPSEIAQVDAGGLVTRLLPVRIDNAAFVVGLTRLETPPAGFVERIRGFGGSGPLRPSGRTLEAGRFGNPPSAADLAMLRFDHQDLRALSRCRVGDCDVQVNRLTMDAAHTIDWRAPAAEARANELLRSAILDRVTAYLREGSNAMAAYDDGVAPEPVARGLARILEYSPEVVARNPAFYDYVERFPVAPRPANVEDFVFWSKERLMNPLVSVVHVFVQCVEGADGDRYYVALKHLYDSHYFLAYAEFLTLLPQPGGGGGCYLVRSVRALINPPQGLLRGLLLGRIKRAMRTQLANDMAHGRQQAEAGRPPAVEP